MERLKRSLKTIAAWFCLLLAAYLVGTVASSTMATYGITSFPNDRRGEWYPLIAPITLLAAVALGLPSFRALQRKSSRGPLTAVVVIAAVAGWAFITWRFANAA